MGCIMEKPTKSKAPAVAKRGLFWTAVAAALYELGDTLLRHLTNYLHQQPK
jgi:hypothetical protein